MTNPIPDHTSPWITGIDTMVGENLTHLRGDMSMDDLVDRMRRRGHKWSKTTLFNVEHGVRQLRINEAFDLLDCLDRDPTADMPLLVTNPVDSKFWDAYKRLKDAMRDFQDARDRLTEAQEALSGLIVTRGEGGEPLPSETLSREHRLAAYKLLRQSVLAADPRMRLSPEEKILQAILGESTEEPGSIVDQALNDPANTGGNEPTPATTDTKTDGHHQEKTPRNHA